MYKAIAANKRNTVIIMAVFVLIIGGLGWLASAIYQDPYITWFVIGFAIIYAAIQYFAAGNVAMALNGAQEIQKKDSPELFRIVENLCISEGLPMPKVYIIDDPAPNAFATGRDPKHAMVAVTTGIMEIMDKRELTAVLAHEISHVRNYDILVSMVVFGLVAAIGMICDLLLRITLFSNDRNSNAPMMLVGLAAMILAPIVALAVQMAVSRQREYLADASGALTTRDSEGLAMALEKLKEYGRPMKKQNTATAHLFFANPLRKSFMSKMFSTHPPLDDRIKRLRDNAAKM